jgi:hypothetical protein
MRRRRRRISRSNPRPPCRRFLRVKTPFHMTMFVLCYWQPAQQQQLARAAQSCPADSTKGAQFVACRGAGMECTERAGRGGRGRAVVACGVGAVTHFPNPIATHLHLLTQLTCISPLTPSRAMLRPARLSCILRAARTHQDRRFSFLFCCHRITHRYGCPR